MDEVQRGVGVRVGMGVGCGWRVGVWGVGCGWRGVCVGGGVGWGRRDGSVLSGMGWGREHELRGFMYMCVHMCMGILGHPRVDVCVCVCVCARERVRFLCWMSVWDRPAWLRASAAHGLTPTHGPAAAGPGPGYWGCACPTAPRH